MEVRVEAGNLVAEYNQLCFELGHRHYDTFDGVLADLTEGRDPEFARKTFSFFTDNQGRIAEVRIPLENLVEPIVFCRQPDAALTELAYLQRYEGRYSNEENYVDFIVRGKSLTATLPDQPIYGLVPESVDVFEIPKLPGYTVHFVSDETGEFARVEFHQPEGIFAMDRDW